MYNIRCSAIRWQINDFLYDVNSNICIFQILVEVAKWKVYLENLGQKIIEYNIRSYAIRQQISTSPKSTWDIF